MAMHEKAHANPHGIVSAYEYDGQNRIAAIPQKVEAYDIRIVMDGSRVQVWRAESGGTMEQIIDTTTKVLSGNCLRWKLGEQVTVRVDDIAFVPDEPELTTFTYNDANEMTAMTKDGTVTTYTYDEWGRTTTKTRGAEEATYQWRFGSMLKKVESTFAEEAGQVDYMYDGLNRRRFKIVDSTAWTWYRYGTESRPLAEYADDDSNFWKIDVRLSTFVGNAAHLKGETPSVAAYTVNTHDHLGSVRATYASNDELEGKYAYQPFGSPSLELGLELTRGFTGHIWDSEINAHYTMYRYLSRSTPRWMSRDPLGTVDGTNVYVYVRSNPIRLLDRKGLQSGAPGIPLDPSVIEPNVICIALAALVAFIGARGSSLQHCVFGCAFARCANMGGGLESGFRAMEINQIYEEANPSEDSNEDDEAAFDGAANCGSADECDTQSCHTCCRNFGYRSYRDRDGWWEL